MRYDMGFFKRLAGLETKKSVAQHSIGFQGLPTTAPKRYDFEQVAKEADLQNAIASRCFQMIREAAATVPLMVYIGDKQDDKHPFKQLLNRPNPYMSGNQLLEHFYGYYSLVGDAYLERVTIGDQVKELYVHSPKDIDVKLDSSNFPYSYEIKQSGQLVKSFKIDRKGTSATDLMHMWSFNPLSAWTGKAAAYSAASAIDAHNASGTWRNSLMNNSAMPSGIITYETENGSNLTDDQFNNLEKELEKKFTGVKNAGRPLILEGGLGWQSIGFNPKDMDTSTLKDADAREIALALGVPPTLIGLKGDSTYSNMKEANAAFYRNTILNLVNKFSDHLTAWLSSIYGESFRIVPDVEKIEALAVERQAVWDKVQTADFLTINEKRELTGYDNIGDEGDKIHIAANMLPLGESGVEGGGEE